MLVRLNNDITAIIRKCNPAVAGDSELFNNTNNTQLTGTAAPAY